MALDQGSSVRAIAIRSVRYGETSLIVTLYTEAHGLVSCMIKGARSSRARIRSTYFQPLSLLEVDLQYREGRQLQRILDVRYHHVFTRLPFDIRRSSISLFVAELLARTLMEEESSPTMFTFLKDKILRLDSEEPSIAAFPLLFLLDFSQHLGFQPQLTAGEAFHPEQGAFMPLGTPGTMDAARSDALRALLQGDGLTHHQRQQAMDVMLRLFATHMPGLGKLQSLEVLRSVMRGSQRTG